MGILQAAYRTYETQAHRAGVVSENETEPLTPVSHMVMNAQIEITLSQEGIFQSARPVAKEEKRTIIPVTLASANRTSRPTPHPLCDQLCYLAPYGGDQFTDYTAQLKKWAESPFSHPIVRAVLAYIQSGSILRDLADAGVIALDETGNPGAGRIEGTEYGKCLVRWRVIPEHPSACWQNSLLFRAFIQFYADQGKGESKDFCMISGCRDRGCEMHPKGIVPAHFGAKLISANDSTGFTYRGRFTQAEQANNVGYLASQKAHNALRWVTVNQGVVWGERTFLCWNPEGMPVPPLDALGFVEEQPRDFLSYQSQLQKTLSGYKNLLKPEAEVVVAALDAATTGRLSVTYYSELRGSDFLRRIENWYSTCCWDAGYGIQSPSVYLIVSRAYGTQRGEKIEVDPKVLQEHAQRLLSCIVEGRPVLWDMVRALVVRAGMPLAYTPKNRESILAVACALVRKHLNDGAGKTGGSINAPTQKSEEEWKLALDTANTDRSYLFGRWLAVMEKVERSAYEKGEKREPSAIRMQAVFVRRPLHTAEIISQKLVPYYEKLNPGLRAYFRGIIDEITGKIDTDDPELEKGLKETYLLGYCHQRSALNQRKDDMAERKEKQNELTEQ